jgi:uncharacterized membrane protein
MVKDNTLGAHLRRTLLAGVVVLVPLFVTIKVLLILFDFTDGLLGDLFTQWFDRPVPGLGLAVFLVGVYLIGLTCRTLVGRVFLRWIETVIGRIPLARTIYSGLKQLLGPFGDGQGRAFGKAVLVEYPATGVYTYGFLVKEHLPGPDGKELVNVFISSNHLHLGAVIVVDRQSVIELGISFEEMIKLMASCGAASPNLQAPHPGTAGPKVSPPREVLPRR